MNPLGRTAGTFSFWCPTVLWHRVRREKIGQKRISARAFKFKLLGEPDSFEDKTLALVSIPKALPTGVVRGNEYVLFLQHVHACAEARYIQPSSSTEAIQDSGCIE
jgi:hypothetical protein